MITMIDLMKNYAYSGTYISHAVSNFYGTEIKILAGWQLKKKLSTFWGPLFMFSGAKRIYLFFKYCSARTKKLHEIRPKKISI